MLGGSNREVRCVALKHVPSADPARQVSPYVCSPNAMRARSTHCIRASAENGGDVLRLERAVVCSATRGTESAPWVSSRPVIEASLAMRGTPRSRPGSPDVGFGTGGTGRRFSAGLESSAEALDVPDGAGAASSWTRRSLRQPFPGHLPSSGTAECELDATSSEVSGRRDRPSPTVRRAVAISRRRLWWRNGVHPARIRPTLRSVVVRYRPTFTRPVVRGRCNVVTPSDDPTILGMALSADGRIGWPPVHSADPAQIAVSAPTELVPRRTSVCRVREAACPGRNGYPVARPHGSYP